MKKTLLTLLILVPLFGFAKGTADLFMMWNQPNYKQYYILEQTINKPKTDKAFTFVYDITYLDTCATITYRFSITEPQIMSIDSIRYIVGERQLVYVNPKQIYVDKTKKGWVHRYELQLTLNDLIAMYNPNQPLHIIAYSDKGELLYQASPTKQWKKTCNSMYEIFNIIQINKKHPQD